MINLNCPYLWNRLTDFDALTIAGTADPCSRQKTAAAGSYGQPWVMTVRPYRLSVPSPPLEKLNSIFKTSISKMAITRLKIVLFSGDRIFRLKSDFRLFSTSHDHSWDQCKSEENFFWGRWGYGYWGKMTPKALECTICGPQIQKIFWGRTPRPPYISKFSAHGRNSAPG